MKKTFFSLVAFIALVPSTKAQSLDAILKRANEVVADISSIPFSSSNPKNKSEATPQNLMNNEEIGSGLREALKFGAQKATNSLSATNGFFGNNLVKILMPPEVREIESKMRQFGMGRVVDKAILSMNRAAEDASSKALPILVNAISTFTIQDAVSILNGGDNAATNLLRVKTTSQLTNAFRPIIAQSMSKMQVEQAWSKVFSIYNTLPIIKNKVNTDLTGYVTEKALSGLFTTIGNEEKKIRLDPVSTGVSIIERVFGSKR